MREKFHCKGKKSSVFIAPVESKVITLHDISTDSGYCDHGQRLEILSAPRANQIAGFPGYHPLTNRDKINVHMATSCM